MLFSIYYINDSVHVSNTLTFMIYDDDTIHYFNMEDVPAINTENVINIELKKVNDWQLHNKFSLNADKIKCMIFHK